MKAYGTEGVMISYSTNWMGPVSTRWYEDNNVSEGGYAAGRIDIRGLDEDDYWCGRHEYGVGVMKQESWNILSDYLRDFESAELLPYKELLEGFEKATGHTIEWFEEH